MTVHKGLRIENTQNKPKVPHSCHIQTIQSSEWMDQLLYNQHIQYIIKYLDNLDPGCKLNTITLFFIHFFLFYFLCYCRCWSGRPAVPTSVPTTITAAASKISFQIGVSIIENKITDLSTLSYKLGCDMTKQIYLDFYYVCYERVSATGAAASGNTGYGTLLGWLRRYIK